MSRFAEEKPDVKWAGLFGAGGENQQYGFEPEVCILYDLADGRSRFTRSRRTATTS